MKIAYLVFMVAVFMLSVLFIPACNSVAPNEGLQKTIDKIISIHFNKPSETFTLAQAATGVHVDYTIAISDDVDTIYSIDVATCNKPDSTGLIPFERLYGNGQTYCLCDNGWCKNFPDGILSTLKKGVYPRSFVWEGKNWEGRSDTGNPLGDPFPAGNYMLNVGIKGKSKVNGSYQVFVISDSIPVALTN
jgi:hypothetical protein